MSKSTQPKGMSMPMQSTLGHITPSQVIGRSLPPTGSHVKKGFTKAAGSSPVGRKQSKNSSV